MPEPTDAERFKAAAEAYRANRKKPGRAPQPVAATPPMPKERDGRVETALEQELGTRPDIGRAERAALRSQAHAVDIAERTRESLLITQANDGYLRLRQAAGLTAGGHKSADSFDALLAEMARASSGSSDQPPAE